MYQRIYVRAREDACSVSMTPCPALVVRMLTMGIAALATTAINASAPPYWARALECRGS